MGNSAPDLKWEKLALVGCGKTSIVWLVRNTVTKEVQLWKYTHTRDCSTAGEGVVLALLQGHDNIQRLFHWDDYNRLLVLKRANGGDLHDYTLDHYGSTRQRMPEIFIWHFLRSMAAALAYCQAGWRDGDPFVVKEGWRPIIHQDVASGNILLEWHKNEALPQLILSDFGDATFLDTMPSADYDYLLRAMRARDPTASHLKRDLQRLGSILQSMLVVHLFGGNAEKMQEDYNVDLAFDFAQKHGEPIFSRELTDLVDQLAYNELTDKSTRFTDALEFAKELIPVANAKIAELAETDTKLPGRPAAGLDDEDSGSLSFHAPLHKDIWPFIRYYEGESIRTGGLKRKHRQGELDPQFTKYRATRIEELTTRHNQRPYFINPGQMVDSIYSWDVQGKQQFNAEQSVHQSDDKSQATTDEKEPEAHLRKSERLTSEAWLAHQAIAQKVLDFTSRKFSNDPAYAEYSRLVKAEQVALEEYRQLQQQELAALLDFSSKNASVPEPQQTATLCQDSTWQAGTVVQEESGTSANNRMEIAMTNAKDGTYTVKIEEGKVVGVLPECGKDIVVEDKKEMNVEEKKR
ncbi:hypothetical protein EPUS_05198 [Endocarpon pusillum Z07020]|uniref:Autophagy-related protein 1 n=1 Tax=Endocarpon pusillum (strain Z07020 / HMAS-L-300199) TaxID=1263415 RepID=U1HMW9_ENDPU|nr:uncharacterized protein EPUS_05198 [Endocarpon pusillum Z07020]ERF70379.1 hypothetical protein EPUS_05198 [Endocarpon pusillum Z07020]